MKHISRKDEIHHSSQLLFALKFVQSSHLQEDNFAGSPEPGPAPSLLVFAHNHVAPLTPPPTLQCWNILVLYLTDTDRALLGLLVAVEQDEQHSNPGFQERQGTGQPTGWVTGVGAPLKLLTRCSMSPDPGPDPQGAPGSRLSQCPASASSQLLAQPALCPASARLPLRPILLHGPSLHPLTQKGLDLLFPTLPAV